MAGRFHIQTSDVLAKPSGDHDHRSVDNRRTRRWIMRVAAEDKVDPFDLTRHFLIDAETVATRTTTQSTFLSEVYRRTVGAYQDADRSSTLA